MVRLNKLSEAENEIKKYILKSTEITGRDTSVKRMKPLMTALGNPQRKLKIIHIAGTSGKTSTAYYIAAMLSASGYKTGLTVSPHVDSIAERVQIDMKPLSGIDFCEALTEVIKLIRKARLIPTYFEFIVALANWYFNKVGVDYAVIETGIGGLYDSTNIADNSNKLCVITDIGYDHMDLLGHTLSEIALQKAGIIHANNEVLMYDQQETINGVIETWCRKQNAFVQLLKQAELRKKYKKRSILDHLPTFQQRNWLLGREVYNYLQNRDNLRVISSSQLAASTSTSIPGRMDKRYIGEKTIIMDGAHNEQKLSAFCDSFNKQYPAHKAVVLLSIKKDKEYKEILECLKPITDKLIICEFTTIKNTSVKSMNAKMLSLEAKKLGFKNVLTYTNTETAYKRLLTETKEVGIIIGSLYLVSELRRANLELTNV